ncbi:hypothetical protein JTE90_011855 [Oedothorax gibbosus]|uniref:Uncharacterized protein n=1 Tax=Oedothorax gibbosus TaxID=931172 RepID=A0AAV6V688_9ARAC|nr:hypothetical protein JTE90_011855 [Oedothorax gibbosus]
MKKTQTVDAEKKGKLKRGSRVSVGVFYTLYDILPTYVLFINPRENLSYLDEHGSALGLATVFGLSPSLPGKSNIHSVIQFRAPLPLAATPQPYPSRRRGEGERSEFAFLASLASRVIDPHSRNAFAFPG